MSRLNPRRLKKSASFEQPNRTHGGASVQIGACRKVYQRSRRADAASERTLSLAILFGDFIVVTQPRYTCMRARISSLLQGPPRPRSSSSTDPGPAGEETNGKINKRGKINDRKLFRILKEKMRYVHLWIRFSTNARKYGEYSLRSLRSTCIRLYILSYISDTFGEYKHGKANEKKLLKILKESVIRL